MKKPIKEFDNKDINAIWFDDENAVQLPDTIKQTAVIQSEVIEYVSPSVSRPYVPQNAPIPFIDTPQYKVAKTTVSWALTGAVCTAAVGGFIWVVVTVLESLSPAFAAFSASVDLAIAAGIKGLLLLAFIFALYKVLPYLRGQSPRETHYETPINNNSFNNPNINIQVNVGGQQNNG